MREKVAVIGAGVCGLSCALTLARENYKVTVFDRSGFPGAGASAAAAGMLTPMGEAGELPFRFVEAGRGAVDIWKDWLVNFAPEALVRNGSLVVAQDDQILNIEHFKDTIASQADEWKTLSGSDLRVLEPDLPIHFSSALFFPNDAHLIVDKALYGLVNALLANGCQLIRDEAYPGELLDTYDRVIDCRGWTEDHDAELLAVTGEAIRLLPHEGFRISRPVRFYSGRALHYLVPQDGDTVILGATMREDAHPIQGMARGDGLLTLLTAARTFDDRILKGSITDIMSGVRPTYPHKLPKIKWSRENRLISANGMYRHGYLLSPVVAQFICDTLSGRAIRRQDIFNETHNHY